MPLVRPFRTANHVTAGLFTSRRQFLAYAASFALAPGAGALAAGNSADLIFRNGRIYTMTAAGGGAVEALAIGGGVILAAGSESDIAALAGPDTKTLDLQGRALFRASSTLTTTRSSQVC